VITVVKPGLLSTIQDEGRHGYRAFGMPMAGALDQDAYAAANLLAGNPRGAAAVEMTLLGGTFRLEVEALVAVTGADMQPTLDGTPVAPWSAFRVPGGGVLAFSGARSGCRCYLAVHGGIDVPVVLGSRSTYTRARVGGLEGRALAAGDSLPVRASPARRPPLRLPPRLAQRNDGPEAVLRVLLGPQDDRFTPDAIRAFLASAYTVSNRNDRMGYQLDGPALAHSRGPDIVSDAVIPGSIQVPGSGRPIVMMADCATVGGYAKIATVVSADLPRLAQARTGATVRFESCTMSAALELLRGRERWLAEVAAFTQGGQGP
jgi:biotin-dependent carboxylase-like uncharacterized protein